MGVDLDSGYELKVNRMVLWTLRPFKFQTQNSPICMRVDGVEFPQTDLFAAGSPAETVIYRFNWRVKCGHSGIRPSWAREIPLER